MSVVANIRINTSAPFPATVKGGGLIAIAKTAGNIWTVSLNFAAVAELGVVSDPANSVVLIWNILTGVYNTVPIAQIFSSKVITKVGGAGQPVTPYAAQPNDEVILVYAVPFTVNVNWAGRTKPLRVVDQTGNASVGSPITITPSAGQTQLAQLNYSYTIDGAGGSITLTPLPDGSGAY
jgi:hypothetical protein